MPPATGLARPGNAAISGHLNWYGVPKAVFFNLKPASRRYGLYARRQRGTTAPSASGQNTTCPWSQCPLNAIFGAASRPQMNLITCEGTFNRNTANYDHRQVVYTEMVQ